MITFGRLSGITRFSRNRNPSNPGRLVCAAILSMHAKLSLSGHLLHFSHAFSYILRRVECAVHAIIVGYSCKLRSRVDAGKTPSLDEQDCLVRGSRTRRCCVHRGSVTKRCRRRHWGRITHVPSRKRTVDIAKTAQFVVIYD